MSASGPRVIYDFGANNGDDLPYYLLKADKVVAVEANPGLAAQISRRFSDELTAGRLVLENCVLTVDDSREQVPFYLHNSNDVLSQFPRPDQKDLAEFTEVMLPAARASRLIREHGDPYYVKIDIEHFDRAILEELFAEGIRPRFISAESHEVGVFAALVSLGRYEAFKLVDGASVHSRYASHPIETMDGRLLSHSFPKHSAGPFGADIPGPWLSADGLFYLLAGERLGWKDIHATYGVVVGEVPRQEPADPFEKIPVRTLLRALVRAVRRSLRARLTQAVE